MAEQVKPDATIGQVLSDEEKERRKINRQINYFIMRYMWQVVHGRGGNESIYTALQMSRERYTRIMDTGVVNYKGRELENLCARTGLNAKIFTGEERFSCLAKEVEGQERRETLVDIADWKELFKLRDVRRAQSQDLTALRRNLVASKRVAEKNKQPKYKKEMEEAEKAYIDQKEVCESCQKKYKEKKDSICEALKKSSRDDNEALDTLYSFLETDCLLKADRVKEFTTALENLDFDILDNLEAGQLKELRDLIKKTASLIDGIIIYKRAKKLF